MTRMCSGKPSFDSGKFHNHCTECKGFGQCIGDYREAHCNKCNKHWFTGSMGEPCYNCARAKGKGRGGRGGGMFGGGLGFGGLGMFGLMNYMNFMGGAFGGGDSDDSDDDMW